MKTIYKSGSRSTEKSGYLLFDSDKWGHRSFHQRGVVAHSSLLKPKPIGRSPSYACLKLFLICVLWMLLIRRKQSPLHGGTWIKTTVTLRQCCIEIRFWDSCVIFGWIGLLPS